MVRRALLRLIPPYKIGNLCEPMRTWLLKRTTGGPHRTTSDRLRPKVDNVLLFTYALSDSDDATERRTYYWPLPSTEEVKGHSKG